MNATLATRKPRKAEKTVQIVARVTFKAEARKAYTCYIVRSSNGVDTYTVTLVNGTATGCDCPARKPCYHMTGCEAAEQKIVAQKAQCEHEVAVAEEILGAALTSDLQAHLQDPTPAQPAIHPSIENYDMGPRLVRSIDPEYGWCPRGYVKQVAMGSGPASCDGCGGFVRHAGYCHKCA
jgi:hypothetical protein